MTWNNGYIADIEYATGFFPEQGPVYLNFSCALNGIEPVPIDDGFTYFELGFGQGLTANILAAANPQGLFYAADFNPAHVCGARQLARSAQLENLVLLESSASELAAGKVDLPKFDFITMYGVYSWVNADIRRDIVAFVNRYLKPGGILYVNYNAMPGRASSLPLQRLLLQHQVYPGGTEVQLGEARRLINGMAEVQARYLTQHADPLLERWLNALSTNEPGYLAHEYMNHGWSALYHLDVAKDFADAGLEFACSASPYNAFPNLFFTSAQRNLLDSIPDGGLRETMTDYILKSTFRQDIFVRGMQRMSSKRRIEWLSEVGLARCAVQESAIDGQGSSVGESAGARKNAAVLASLADAPKTLLQLAELPEFSGTGISAVAETAAVLIGARQASPYLPRTTRLPATPALAINRSIARRACIDDRVRVLASPLLGSGVPAGQIQRLVYLVLNQHGDAINADAIAEAVWQFMQPPQHEAFSASKNEESGGIGRTELWSIVSRILTHRLPIWRQLDMI